MCCVYCTPVLSVVAGNTKARYLVWHEQRAQCSQLYSKILYVLKIKSHNQGCKYPAKCACNTTAVSKLHDVHVYIYWLCQWLSYFIINMYVIWNDWMFFFVN